MSPDRLKELNNWVAMSREIFELAAANDWKQVIACDEIRRERINAFFQEPISPADAEQVRSAINEVMAIDAKVKTMSLLARSEIASNVKAIRKQSKAAKTYLESTGS